MRLESNGQSLTELRVGEADCIHVFISFLKRMIKHTKCVSRRCLMSSHAPHPSYCYLSAHGQCWLPTACVSCVPCVLCVPCVSCVPCVLRVPYVHCEYRRSSACLNMQIIIFRKSKDKANRLILLFLALQHHNHHNKRCIIFESLLSYSILVSRFEKPPPPFLVNRTFVPVVTKACE